MKNILSLPIRCLWAVALGLGTFACQDDSGLETGNNITYQGKPFVIFQTDASTTSEDEAAPVTIAVLRGARDATAALTVDYTVSSRLTSTGASADNQFTITDKGKVTIPAGAHQADIALTPVDNTVRDGDKEILITLTSVSDAAVNVGYPGPAAASKTHAVTIQDDDCPLVLEDFVGSYDVTIGQTGFHEGGTHEHTCQISLGAEPNTLVISNLWDVKSIGASADYNVKVVFDPVTRTATIPDQPFYLNSSGASRSVTTGDLAPGKIATCNLSFTLNFLVYRTANGTGDLVDQAENVVFTRQ
jgi:hypothetical protein